MNVCTYGLYLLFKFFEMIFLFVWSGIIISSASEFIGRITSQDEMDGKDIQCIVFVSISATLTVFNALYNNLLTNCRFFCKTESVTIGWGVYDVVNFAICH